jgi:hypothetical protein
MARCGALLACCGLALLAAHALAQENPYFPTSSGSSWNYVSSNGGMTTSVIGAETYHGTPVIRVDQLTTRIGIENLVSYKYLLDASGNVYLVGLALPNSLQDLNSIYTPFMLEFPAIAEMEPSWQDTFTGSTYFGDDFVYELQNSVVHIYEANEEVTVPAGVFQALRVSTQWNDGSLTISWYSLGIGVVQFQDLIGQTFKLTDYQIGTVSNETANWGGIKSMFR